LNLVITGAFDIYLTDRRWWYFVVGMSIFAAMIKAG